MTVACSASAFLAILAQPQKLSDPDAGEVRPAEDIDQVGIQFGQARLTFSENVADGCCLRIASSGSGGIARCREGGAHPDTEMLLLIPAFRLGAEPAIDGCVYDFNGDGYLGGAHAVTPSLLRS